MAVLRVAMKAQMKVVRKVESWVANWVDSKDMSRAAKSAGLRAGSKDELTAATMAVMKVDLKARTMAER